MDFLKKAPGNLKSIGVGIAGGAIGRVATNKFGDKIPVIGTNAKLKPAGAFILGTLLMGGKGDMMRDGGFGMAVVAGTDILSGYVPMVQVNNGSPITGIDDLADELANELDSRINADVNAASNMNDDMNDDITADVNASSNMNDEMNDDNVSDEMNDDN